MATLGMHYTCCMHMHMFACTRVHVHVHVHVHAHVCTYDCAHHGGRLEV